MPSAGSPMSAVELDGFWRSGSDQRGWRVYFRIGKRLGVAWSFPLDAYTAITFDRRRGWEVCNTQSWRRFRITRSDARQRIYECRLTRTIDAAVVN